MSDTRGRKPRVAPAVLFALAVALLLGASAVGTGAIVGAIGAGAANARSVGAASSVGAKATPPNSAAGSLAYLASQDAAGFANYVRHVLPDVAAQVSPTEYANAWNEAMGLANDASRGHPSDAGVRAFGASTGDWAVAGGTLTILSVLCGLAVVSGGLSCVVGVVAIALIILFEFLFGSDSAGALGAAATNLAKLMIHDAAYYGFDGQAAAIDNTVQALNGTENAMGYSAAAASLAQLPNSTFNSLSDEVSSGTAAELASVIYADQVTVASYYSSLLSTFSSEEGSDNSAGFSCPLVDTALGLNTVTGTNIVEPNAGGTVCPVTASSYTYSSGDLQMTTQVGGLNIATLPTSNAPSDPAIYVTGAHATANSSHFWAGDTGATFTKLTFVPVNGSHPWTNVTSAATHQLVNFTVTGLPTGGYWVFADAAGVKMYGTDIFPLDDNALPASTLTPIVTPNSLSSGLVNTTAYVLGGDPCAGTNTNVCAPINGKATTGGGGLSTSAVNAQLNATHSLYTLLKESAVVGNTYWQFLRNLGYTNANQVPARCIIPTPGAILPTVITSQQLQTLNVTSLLNLYYAALYSLAYTFNATNGLTISNFCGKHVTFSPSNVTIAFGTFGLGWIYVAGAGNSSDGKVPQVFGTPSTWNLSGLIYLGPATANLTPTLNTTWLFGETNPPVAFVTPLTNGTPKANGVAPVNRNAPTTCLTYHASGCNSTLTFTIATGFLPGNSTLPAGSAYPGHIDASVGAADAVYLTVCYVATPASIASGTLVFVTHPSTCNFQHETVSGVGNTGPCGTLFGDYAGCGTGSGGGVLIFGGGSCGWGTIPILSQIANGVASFVGTGFLGCLVVDAVVLLVILVVFVLVVAVALAVVRRE